MILLGRTLEDAVAVGNPSITQCSIHTFGSRATLATINDLTFSLELISMFRYMNMLLFKLLGGRM